MIPAFDCNGIDVILFKGQNVVFDLAIGLSDGIVDPSVETKFPSVEPQAFVYINIYVFKSDVFINIFSANLGLKEVKIGLLGRPQTRVIQAKLGLSVLVKIAARNQCPILVEKTAFSGR